ncbi:MAG: hypothetical protein O7G85_08180 [Planctomycetota bacterium]|nr:hypothetical protein [Planctomycetota bacterium]
MAHGQCEDGRIFPPPGLSYNTRMSVDGDVLVVRAIYVCPEAPIFAPLGFMRTPGMTGLQAASFDEAWLEPLVRKPGGFNRMPMAFSAFGGDCNLNGIPDVKDISSGLLTDCNDNQVPDECELGNFGICPSLTDCNENGIPDECDLGSGSSLDDDGNGVPDECDGCPFPPTVFHVYRYNALTENWDFEHEIRELGLTGSWGRSVSVSGDRIAIGAESDPNGTVCNAGAVYVYTFDPKTSTWPRETILRSSVGESTMRFGRDVDMQGDRLLVGAPGLFNTGAAFVFDFNASNQTWEEKAILTASDAEPSGSSLGLSYGAISLDGDWAIVGEFLDQGSCNGLDGGCTVGAAYIFGRNPATGQWSQRQKLAPLDDSFSQIYGASVEIRGDLAVVHSGGPEDYTVEQTRQVIYIYRNTGSAWTLESINDVTIPETNLVWIGTGRRILINGDEIDFGQFWDIIPTLGIQGFFASVQRFRSDATTGDWNLVEKMLPSDQPIDGSVRMIFGSSIFLHDTQLVVAGDSDFSEGGPYLFELAGRELIDFDEDFMHDPCEILLGLEEDVDGDGLPDSAERALGDIDLSGVVDVFDLLAVLAQWGACVDPCHADVNGDEVVDVNDLLILLAAWGPVF